MQPLKRRKTQSAPSEEVARGTAATYGDTLKLVEFHDRLVDIFAAGPGLETLVEHLVSRLSPSARKVATQGWSAWQRGKPKEIKPAEERALYERRTYRRAVVEGAFGRLAVELWVKANAAARTVAEDHAGHCKRRTMEAAGKSRMIGVEVQLVLEAVARALELSRLDDASRDVV